jgi:hypothetical protein
MRRQQDRKPISGPAVAQVQMATFRDWEKVSGKRFADLKAGRTTGARGQWYLRRDDACLELLLAKREPSKGGSSHLPRLRSWIPLSVSRVVHETSDGFSRIHFVVRALLNCGARRT